ncbi:uncharacterized protein [Diadema antillarum]|uniref:uncharacterized protein n=1 Tax=Diadema antillarum TaxID=105358 RepID=UPI003A854496
MTRRSIKGVPGLLPLLLSAATLRMTTLRMSKGHTVFTALTHFFLVHLTLLRNILRMQEHVEAWKNPRQIQEEYLLEIIRKNCNTVYGKQHKIKAICSLTDLQEQHPLTVYERYRSYVDRMAMGEKGVLTQEFPERFALTSGTTGKSKMWPYLKSFLARQYGILFGLTMRVTFDNFPLKSSLQRDIWLYTAPKTRYTDGGFLTGPGSLIPRWMKMFLVMTSTPPEGFFISRPFEATYIHLLFGLRDRNLGGIQANFTSNLMSAMRQLEYCWRDIVHDIEKGSISYLNLASDVQEALTRALGDGDPKRADELRTEFEKGFDGIIRRVWPHIQYINAIDSAGLREVLLDSYAKDIPIFAPGYGATEGIMGINLWPTSGKDEFVLLPGLTVYEFIPENNMNDDDPQTILIDELDIGGVYELIITQSFGIYRFRCGDVIKVTRFHQNTPVIEFMYRSGQMLNVTGEKVDQRMVHQAMTTAVGSWPTVKIQDYAVAESSLLEELDQRKTCTSPYYIVFIELDREPEFGVIDQEQYCLIDEELRQLSPTYHLYRENGSVATPSVHIVKPGTFNLLHDFILTNSTTAANQYKVPRKLRTPQTLRLMLDNSAQRSNNFGRMSEI